MVSSDQTSLREQKKEGTRRALATAAAELLLSEGSDGMTVAAVAERAGVSARTFHNYFPRREDALLYFIDVTIDEWRVLVEEAPQDEHPLDTMHRLISDRVSDSDDSSQDPGTLLNLMSIGDHLGYIAGPEDKERVVHLADGLLDALYRRTSGNLSRQGTALMMISCLAAGAIAVEALPHAPRGTATAEKRGLCPSWAAVDGKNPKRALEDGFALLRGGFGG
ncbi:MAG: TetR/AcrR family transcriptional regulator [Corynebacterium sp.]|uniref:TetR/AcrR family transcriptional regulator n=1 Tax=Corynebacterium sp. TaxID=1720 RepID=UPI003F9B8681